MKAHVDPETCEGFGLCSEILPEVFVLDEEGYAHAGDDGEVTADREDDARRAVHTCPVKAITLRNE
jgi:ferredoxin